MELLPKKLEESLPKLFATEEISLEDKIVVAKFFILDSNWVWYAVEGSPENDNFLFFGLVNGFEREWGYFSLNELTSFRGPLGLPVERDLYFTPQTIKQLKL